MSKKLICMFMERATMKKGIFLLVVSLTIICSTSSYASAASSSGLIGYWPFDGDTMDKSGSGYHATAVNGPTYVPGIAGQAIQLDADAHNEGQYLTVIPPTSVPVPWTVSVWVNRHKDAVNYAASGLMDGGFETEEWSGLRLEQYQGSHQVGFTNYGSGNWYWDYLTPIDEWVHLVFIGTDTEATLYVDAVLIGTLSEAASEPLWIDWIGKTHEYNCPVDADLDELGVWNRALTEEEVLIVFNRGPLALARMASEPNPDNRATDVPRDVALSWTPGELASTHDVYLGTVFDDVNDADRSDPRGVLASEEQIATTYVPPGRLDFGQIYYWRIDEVSAPPDSAIVKGDNWSFTTEPFSYPIENVTATASSSVPGQGPENTVNGSGLDNDRHSIEPTEMWLSGSAGPQPTWIQYEFDKVYKLHEMWVWNHNGMLEQMVGIGFKDVSIEYSVNGTDYTTLGTTHEFAQGTGAAGYEHNTTVDFGGASAKFVRLTANSSWVGFLPQYGLSEVRFLYIPVFAREPSPDSGAKDVDVDVTLSWRAGRDTAKHNVYFSTDEQSVIDGTAPVITAAVASYGPLSLDFGKTYYWRVDEVNDAETPTTWQSEIWNLTTREFLVVEDFELYNDLNPEEPGSNRIYLTWIDGLDNPATNGSIVGYDVAPFAETSAVYDGKQSAPIFYNNTVASLSEVTVNTSNLPIGTDWTIGSPQMLVLWVHGNLTNAPEQMYVKIDNTKELYGGDISQPFWRQWNIDLAALGINPSNVTQLAIGFEKTGATGGSGMVFVDEIRLYREAPPPPSEEIWIEAEAATTIEAPMEIHDDPNAMGGKYIMKDVQAAESTGNPPADGLVTYTFTVAGGTYKVAGRVITISDNDSFWVRIPGATTQTTNHSSGWVNWNGITQKDVWGWEDVFSSNDFGHPTVEFTLPAGTHTLEIRYREDESKLDALVITSID